MFLDDVVLYILVTLIIITLLFVTVYILTKLTDLESDIINNISCCSSLNKVVPVELGLSGAIVFLLLTNMKIFHVIFQIPLFALLLYRYTQVPRGNIGIFDPTELLNRKVLQGFIFENGFKLVLNCLCFLMNIYCFITTLL